MGNKQTNEGGWVPHIPPKNDLNDSIEQPILDNPFLSTPDSNSHYTVETPDQIPMDINEQAIKEPLSTPDSAKYVKNTPSTEGKWRASFQFIKYLKRKNEHKVNGIVHEIEANGREKNGEDGKNGEMHNGEHNGEHNGGMHNGEQNGGMHNGNMHNGEQNGVQNGEHNGSIHNGEDSPNKDDIDEFDNGEDSMEMTNGDNTPQKDDIEIDNGDDTLHTNGELTPHKNDIENVEIVENGQITPIQKVDAPKISSIEKFKQTIYNLHFPKFKFRRVKKDINTDDGNTIDVIEIKDEIKEEIKVLGEDENGDKIYEDDIEEIKEVREIKEEIKGDEKIVVETIKQERIFKERIYHRLIDSAKKITTKNIWARSEKKEKGLVGGINSEGAKEDLKIWNKVKRSIVIKDMEELKYEKYRYPEIAELSDEDYRELGSNIDENRDDLSEESIVEEDNTSRNDYDVTVIEEENIARTYFKGQTVLIYWNDEVNNKVGFNPGTIVEYHYKNNELEYLIKYDDGNTSWEVIDDGFVFKDPNLEEKKEMILGLRKKRYVYNNVPKRRKNFLKPTHEYDNKYNKKRNRDSYEDREDVKRKKTLKQTEIEMY
jgi:hypothetical protein